MFVQLSEKNGGQGQPEFRMPGVLLGALFVPIGLLCVPSPLLSPPFLARAAALTATSRGVVWCVCSWYGWSAQAGVHWIMPIIGTAIYGFGQMLA